MKHRDPPKAPDPPPAGGTPPPRNSGRVKFDERGQAVWEWAVKTGMFDRNASTQRIKALVEAPLNLSIDEGTPPPTGPSARPAGGDLYERAAPKPGLAQRGPDLRGRSGDLYERVRGPAAQPGSRVPDAGGSDPYSRGPAKNPEDVSFNPYERPPPRKR